MPSSEFQLWVASDGTGRRMQGFYPSQADAELEVSRMSKLGIPVKSWRHDLQQIRSGSDS